MNDSLFGGAYAGKTVLVTGHTGFKGSWLSEWLVAMGARVVGFSLDPPTTPSLFETLRLAPRLAADVRADVRSLESIEKTLTQHRPHFVFHLAAQALVRPAYDEPRATFDVNCMGSVNVLEAVRRADARCVVIMVTTDKVYENAEWAHAYREPDPLGGHDPYSASKACAEIAIASYRRSFFRDASGASSPSIAVASVRAGNVIGGGDWAADRIVADCARSLAAGKTIPVRNRLATRAWQHVLEPLSGYLHLAAEISRAVERGDRARLDELCSAYNFGPQVASNRSVRDLVEAVLQHWPGGRWEDFTPPDARHEAGRLNLAVDKAYHALGWQPKWGFDDAVRNTVEWYRAYYRAPTAVAQIGDMTRRQIDAYAAGLSYPTSAGG